EDKADSDGRTDIALYALEIDVQLRAELADEGDPEQAEDDHDAGGDAAKRNELKLGGLRPELFVEVESDHGRGRIEDRAHRAHKSGEESGNHETDEAGGEQIDDHQWIGDIAVGDFAVDDVEHRGVEAVGNEARENKQENRQNLQEAGKD